MHIGKTIRRLQNEKGVNCSELARGMGVLPQQVSRWRQSEDLKFSIVSRLAKFFKVSLDEFL